MSCTRNKVKVTLATTRVKPPPSSKSAKGYKEKKGIRQRRKYPLFTSRMHQAAYRRDK